MLAETNLPPDFDVQVMIQQGKIMARTYFTLGASELE
jgi:hypothetical protein